LTAEAARSNFVHYNGIACSLHSLQSGSRIARCDPSLELVTLEDGMSMHTASPIALELALSRVSLAALKAKRREKVTKAEQASAVELSEVLRRDIDTLRGPQSINPASVPIPAMRAGLERALATISRQATQRIPGDTSILERLLLLLTPLADTGRLTPRAATEILQVLEDMERARERRPPSPHLGALEEVRSA
jgi:hypothetical protein